MLEQAQRGTPEYWAEEDPDRIAVIDGNETMTYGEWNDLSNRVADSLASKGLKAGDKIGMRFRLGFSWFVMQRALQKLGVAQVAVNWKLTPPEATYIIEDSGSVGLACNDAEASLWGDLDIGMLITVGQPEGSAGIRYEDLIAAGEPTPRFGAAQANFILYTSGTTGKPKGVPPRSFAPEDMEKLTRYMKSVSSVPPHPAAKPTILLALPLHHGAGAGCGTPSLPSRGHCRFIGSLRSGRSVSADREALCSGLDHRSDHVAQNSGASGRGVLQIRPQIAGVGQYGGRARASEPQAMVCRKYRRRRALGSLRMQ